VLQYASIIFYHDEEQKNLAAETLTEEAKKHSDPILTKILSATTFHDAEEYVYYHFLMRTALTLTLV
jgi:peptide-methionine (S)-S-oxide reductase